jgi:hypothetical protein
MGLEDEIRSRKAQHADDSKRRAAAQRIEGSGFENVRVWVHTPSGSWADQVGEMMPILKRHAVWSTRTLYEDVDVDGSSILLWRKAKLDLGRLKKLPAGGRPVRGTLVPTARTRGTHPNERSVWAFVLDSGLVIQAQVMAMSLEDLAAARKWVVDLGAGVAKSPPADQKL